MSARELIVLGTASQVPTRTRAHNALFLAWDDLGILFDPGEGTQRQMTIAGIAASRITHIAITHFHGDHCLGLASIIQRISLDRVPRPVEVFFPASGREYFERLRHASIFHDRATIVPRPVPLAGAGGSAGGGGDHPIEIARAGAHRLLAHPLDHGVDCCGYRVEEAAGRRMLPDRLAAAGIAGEAVGELQRAGAIVAGGTTVRLEDVSAPRPGQSFTLVMDTRPCPGALALARGVDLLACESTFLESEAEEADAYRHMTAAQAARLGRDAGARRLVLTHFSPRYTDDRPFAAEAAAHHPDAIVAADLTHVAVPARLRE